ncbi:protein disulfide isomerase pTAC5, chloroplastic-like [Magnolia sinica]|uniref:protein disulfide isomerase pTAC5, chloroplastic-like n=1 Tax=Magnolia sinica TaxID=86752 RepID=UPI002657BB65|nr:protein disulfide isomerase pTAC5, chloroplastic-like [Magnolia sinica]
MMGKGVANKGNIRKEALEKLGSYSGEEDMEYSSFSSGIERVVKTWKASVGTREDGVMTAELLENAFSFHWNCLDCNLTKESTFPSKIVI